MSSAGQLKAAAHRVMPGRVWDWFSLNTSHADHVRPIVLILVLVNFRGVDVYIESYKRDDSDPAAKKRHFVEVEIPGRAFRPTNL